MYQAPRLTTSLNISGNRATLRTSLDSHGPHSPSRKRPTYLVLLLALLTNTSAMAGEPQEVPKSSGTGFVVSRQGHILTNHHVVASCPSIRVVMDGMSKEAPLIAIDEENDLALLKLPQPMRNVARFRKGRSIRAGDGIVVVGFPYHRILALEANVTNGVVSALAGLRNDSRFIQISAPVQPGNSGGPVLDSSGHVVGVVESKLNALAMALITGDIPQNVNFAIKDITAKSFLDSRGIAYEATVSEKQLEPGEIGEIAKRFTYLIECHSETIDAKKKRIEEEHRALADNKRRLEAAREHVRILEQEERAREAREIEAKRKAAEQEELQRKKELAEREAAEMEAASKRVIRFHAEEREIEFAEQAQSKGREALARSAARQEESVRIAAIAARDRALNAGESVLEEARRRGQSIFQWSPSREVGKRQLDVDLSGVRQFQPLPAVRALESSKTSAFWARIEALITNNWVPPSVTEDANVGRATLRFRYYRDGRVRDVALVEGSKDSFFNYSALRALMARSTLPSFPEEVPEPFRDVEIVFKNITRVGSKRVPQKSDLQPMGSESTLSDSSDATPTSIFNNAHRAFTEERYGEAATGFQRIVRYYFTNPLVPEAHYWLGESYFRLKDYMGATQHFRILLGEYPGNHRAPDALFKLGLMGETTGEPSATAKRAESGY